MKENQFTLSLISSYRNHIFGVATLAIVLFHSSLVLPVSLPFLTYVKNNGNLGVDIFMFLSALGLYYSFSNNENLKMFYSKRLQRVLIPYLIVVPLYFCFDANGVANVIGRLSFLTFFRDGDRIEWFIVFIMMFYLVFPLLYYTGKRYKNTGMLCWLVISFLINALLSTMFKELYDNIEIGTTRFPIFVIGCMIAPYIKKGTNIPLFYVWLFVLSQLALYGCFYLYPLEGIVYRYSYIPLTIAFVLFLSLVLDYLNLHKASFILQLLKYIGGRTLEIYLIHEKVLLLTQFLPIVDDRHNILINMFAFMVTLILSEFLHILIMAILNNF